LNHPNKLKGKSPYLNERICIEFYLSSITKHFIETSPWDLWENIREPRF